MAEEPERVDLSTPDIAENNRKALAALFPGVLADGVLDATRLGEMLDVEVTAPVDGRERFGLTWAGKHEAIRSLLMPSRGTLVPDLEKSVEFDTAENVFIEGDNLEVLKLLQKAYNDKVKLIYIDPPYNTGNDFVYNDDFTDGLRGYLEYTGQVDEEGNRLSASADTSGRRHSKWLSMMYPRLVLARNLLTQDGVLLASIDDNELSSLLLVLDEVFGRENRGPIFVWQKKKKPSFLRKSVGSISEYVVCYFRDSNCAFPFSVDVTTAGKKYPLNNAGNPLATLTFPAGSVQFAQSDAKFDSQDMSGGNIVTRLLDPVTVREGRNLEPFRLEGEWRYGQAKLDEILAADEAITISKAPFRPNHVKEGGEVKKMHNLLTPSTYNVGTNEDGTAEVEKLLGGPVFDNPKPTSLIRTLVRAVTYDDPEALILDFFAGSGTTAHAVMLQNAADGGRRRVISVNLPEAVDADSAAGLAGYSTVADITFRRIVGAMSIVEGAPAMGLRVFKLGQSNFRAEADSEGEGLLDLSPSTLLEGDPDLEGIAAEVLLNEGVCLHERLQRQVVESAPMVVSRNVAVVLSLSIDDDLVDAALGLKPRVLNFLEDGFSGKDDVKTNAFTSARELGITMKTV